jgi:hypothetical protein
VPFDHWPPAGSGGVAAALSVTSTGRYILKVVPCPCSLYTQMLPPLCLTMP